MELSTNNLRKSFRERGPFSAHRPVVKGVSLSVKQGEIVGLLGQNGAGKTTTFYMVVGLVRPDSGRVLLDGRDITGLPMYRRARLGVGYLAQEPSVFQRLTVEQNLCLILEMRGQSRAQQKRETERLLNELGIAQLADRLGRKLSGGERRRVEIARLLAADPKFVLLDEPLTGVDPIAVRDVQQLVLGLKRRGIGVLITDHNVRETLAITDRAYIMYDGEILTSGISEQ